jgi:hypothetical protein
MGLAPGDPREVDHRDHVPLNNRRSNLRIVTHAGNCQNTSSQRGKTSLHRGVYWAKSAGKWRATVKVGGTMHRLGLFDDETEAAAVAREGRKRMLPDALD